MRKTTLVIICLLVFPFAATAQEFNTDKIYYGGGLSSNDLSGFSSEIGYQFFAGYPLDVMMGTGKLSIEAGYMDAGDFSTTILGIPVTSEAKGFWGTAVGTWPISNELNAIGRVGLDVGDDDGLMFGGGLGYKLNKNVTLRGEFVVRDNVDSLQFNVVYYL